MDPFLHLQGQQWPVGSSPVEYSDPFLTHLLPGLIIFYEIGPTQEIHCNLKVITSITPVKSLSHENEPIPTSWGLGCGYLSGGGGVNILSTSETVLFQDRIVSMLVQLPQGIKKMEMV